MKKTLKKVIAIVLTMVLFCSTMSIMGSAASIKVDVAFVVDTTGSMDDDIAQVKADMKNYLADMKAKGWDYRIAIVDYRDFASRAGSEDYPYKVQLNFTADETKIINAINKLSLGNGGDGPETVYSALIDGVNSLSWRGDTDRNAIILMGDAPALDPEPYTNYTKSDVLKNLGAKSLTDLTPKAASAKATSRGKIVLFAIATGSAAKENFESIATGTGGACYEVGGSAEITDAIDEILDEIPSAGGFDIMAIFEFIWSLIMSVLDIVLSLLP